MFPTATVSSYQSLLASSVKPLSVIKSSDASGWQNVRAVHFRQT